MKSFLKGRLRSDSVMIVMDQIHETKILSYTEGFVDLYLSTNLAFRQRKKRKAKRIYTSPCSTSVEEHCDLSALAGQK